MEIENLPNGKLFSKRIMPLLGDGNILANNEEAEAVEKSVENEENNIWRGQGGGKTSLHSIQFDKQMDNISLWLEEWDHQTVSIY